MSFLRVMSAIESVPCTQTAYISKDGIEISEVLSGVPEGLQPLYKEVGYPKHSLLSVKHQ